jgi:hypothetical protein
MGYATTNNPCETFNASVKRHVMRKMFDTVRLLRKLVIITEDVTADKITPATSCGAPPSTLVKSARAMVHSRRLAIFQTENVAVVRVVQQQGQNEGFTHQNAAIENAFARLTTSKTTGGMEEHLARRQRRKASAMYGNAMKWSVYMAHKMKMPILGWTVNTDEATCQCCYFAKMGHCCHLVGAWILTGNDRLAGQKGSQKLKNRRVRKNRRDQHAATSQDQVDPVTVVRVTQQEAVHWPVSSSQQAIISAWNSCNARQEMQHVESDWGQMQQQPDFLLSPCASPQLLPTFQSQASVYTPATSYCHGMAQVQEQEQDQQQDQQQQLLDRSSGFVSEESSMDLESTVMSGGGSDGAQFYRRNRGGRPPLVRPALEIQYLLN